MRRQWFEHDLQGAAAGQAETAGFLGDGPIGEGQRPADVVRPVFGHDRRSSYASVMEGCQQTPDQRYSIDTHQGLGHSAQAFRFVGRQDHGTDVGGAGVGWAIAFRWGGASYFLGCHSAQDRAAGRG